MGCANCEKVQELNSVGKHLAYLRVGVATVLVGACDQHFNQVRRAITGEDIDVVVCRMNPAKGFGG